MDGYVIRQHFGMDLHNLGGRTSSEFDLMPSQKNGFQRKRRGEKVRAASVAGRTWFIPSHDDWQRLEKRLGATLDAEDREHVVKIIDNYFEMQPFERAAPHLNDVRRYVEQLQAKANDFQKALSSVKNPEATNYAQRLITWHFNSPFSAHPDHRAPSASRAIGTGSYQVGDKQESKKYPSLHTWQVFYMAVAAFVAAGERAEKDLARIKGGGTIEGYAWKILIKALTSFCKNRSLPTAASKGALKGDKNSPFVAFIDELQRTFPPKFRQYSHSLAGLAAAITSARAGPRELSHAKGQIKLPSPGRQR